MQPLPPNGTLIRAERMQMTLMASALVCLALSLLFGFLAALYYIPEISARAVKAGISLVQLRPLHTTFASAWLFLGAVTAVQKYLSDEFGLPTANEARRFRLQMILWGLAGLAAAITLPLGITSGREYVGFHPSISALIAGGWLLFAWTFFARVGPDFFKRPVYVYMWAAGILYFLYTFAEAHAWLLDGVWQRPVADLQIQWKSCGALVAAFNQMVYGGLTYFGAKHSGDERIGHSRTAFALFGVGLLNSLTNYAHHTYHLPQSHAIKWIAFAVSMLEIILLLRLLHEVSSALRLRRRPLWEHINITERLTSLAKHWNVFLLTLALAISVPPWNSLIHGTHVVMAHAMGSELAIDTYILLGLFAWVLATIFPKREAHTRIIHSPRVARAILGLNVSLVGLVAILLASGVTTGIQRAQGKPMPAWLDYFPFGLLLFGSGVAVFLVVILLSWLPLFRHPATHKAWDAGGGPLPTPPPPR